MCFFELDEEVKTQTLLPELTDLALQDLTLDLLEPT